MGEYSRSYVNKMGQVFDFICESNHFYHENGFLRSYPAVTLKNRDNNETISVLCGTLDLFYKEYHRIEKSLTNEELIEELTKFLNQDEKVIFNSSLEGVKLNEMSESLVLSFCRNQNHCIEKDQQTEFHADTIEFLKNYTNHVLLSFLLSDYRKKKKEDKKKRTNKVSSRKR